MDITSLYYFTEVAKDLHITKTANRLYSSQQTLSNHIQRLEEYYPGALEETYAGVSGYIYTAEKVTRRGHPIPIPGTVTSRGAVPVAGCEFIPDAWAAIRQAESEGLLVLRRYDEMTEDELDWMRRTVREEYLQAADHPEYRHFLQAKFRLDPQTL